MSYAKRVNLQLTTITNMTRFNDLSDDCLLEVLERLPPGQLFKMQRVNRRLKQLAAVKMRTKIRAIALHRGDDIANCAHHAAITRDQVMVPRVLCIMLSNVLKKDPAKRALFLTMLAKCSGIKSIDFANSEFPCDLLLEVVKRCPELECIKFGTPYIEEQEWDPILKQIGSRIVHFVRNGSREDGGAEDRLFSAVATNCPNIKRVDWTATPQLNLFGELNRMWSSFKLLPKSCYFTLDMFKGDDTSLKKYEDICDEFSVLGLRWSALGRQVNRLSSLKVLDLQFGDGPVSGVEFTRLKKLDYLQIVYNQKIVNCLVLSRFPLLEEFVINVCAGLTQDDYEGIFRRMPSLKKLTMRWNVRLSEHFAPHCSLQLPGSAIHQLKKLETLVLSINRDPSKQPENIFKQIEHYVDGITSLKRLNVDIGYDKFDEWLKKLEDEINRMKLKQKRVEINLVVKN